MIGDWIFIVLLLAIFICFTVVGNMILVSSEDITPSLRKSDSKMKDAFFDLQTSGKSAFYDGIIGIVLVSISAVFFMIPVIYHHSFEKIWLSLKILCKIAYALLAAASGFYAGSQMSKAISAMQASHTYKIPKAKKNVQSGIDSSILAANVLYGLSAGIIGIFLIMTIYDIKTKNNFKAQKL